MATVTEPAILTAAAVEALLRECCTVVKPGETLIVRVPADASPRHVHQLGQYVAARVEAMGAGFHTLVVPAESLGTGEAPGVTHACPPDGSGGLMPCCGQTPFEVPRTERITLDPALVTCKRNA